MNEPNKPKRSLTVSEAAGELGISRNAAYEAVRVGEIPALRIGRRVIIPRVAFEFFLESAGNAKSRDS